MFIVYPSPRNRCPWGNGEDRQPLNHMVCVTSKYGRDDVIPWWTYISSKRYRPTLLSMDDTT